MNNKEKKNNILIGAVVILLIVIAIVGFTLGKQSINKTVDTKVNTSVQNKMKDNSTGNYQDLTITVIGDKRCGEECPTTAILEQLKQLPSIKNAKIIVKDFSDTGVVDYLKANEVKALPLFAFSTNNFNTKNDPVQTNPQTGQPVPKIDTFLKPMKDGEYILPLGASFNPFAKRSENGFLMLDKTKLKSIKDSSFIKGNKNAKITWLEYSDLECPYCAKLHNSGTEDELNKKYGDKLNMVFNSFPLPFHKNAEVGAEILECLGNQKGTDAFYKLIDKAYSDKKSDKEYLISEAIKLGANEDKLNKCLTDGTYKQKVTDTKNAGVELFGITGTPGNVLINNETGEYEIISGAYPTSSFEAIIDKLLK